MEYEDTHFIEWAGAYSMEIVKGHCMESDSFSRSACGTDGPRKLLLHFDGMIPSPVSLPSNHQQLT